MRILHRIRSASLLLLLFLLIIKPTEQYTYSCNPADACGCSASLSTTSRIVGGEAAGAGTWGWATFLYIGGYLCGGSVLSSQWIITAAHCVDGMTASQITAYVGSNTRYSGQSRSASAIYQHPSYNRTTYENDIALIRLTTPINMLDPNVKPVCLPSVSASTLAAGEWPSANLYVVAVGWGRLTEGGVTSNTLQQVTVQTIDYRNTSCQNILNNRQMQFCAGVAGGGKDTCQGDSGGPLMMFTTSSQWVLVGVTSYGYGCARPQYPGVYTRVAYYTSWINSITSGSYVNATSSVSANINPFSNSTTTTATTATTTTTTTTTATTTTATTTSATTTTTTTTTTATTATTATTTTATTATTTTRRNSSSRHKPISSLVAILLIYGPVFFSLLFNY